MNFQTYQELIKTFAVYPSAHTKGLNEAMYLALGLNGEAGEVAEKIKKWFRDGGVNIEDIKKEIGDVFWYGAMLCSSFNLSVDEVLQANVDKLSRRKVNKTLHGSGDNR